MRPIPESERDDLVGAYARQMQGTNELQRMAAAKAWSSWSARCATVQPHQRLIKHYSDAHRALSLCRIGTHYFANECFLEPGNCSLTSTGSNTCRPPLCTVGSTWCVRWKTPSGSIDRGLAPNSSLSVTRAMPPRSQRLSMPWFGPRRTWPVVLKMTLASEPRKRMAS